MKEEQARRRRIIEDLVAAVSGKIAPEDVDLAKENLEYNELGEALTVLSHGVTTNRVGLTSDWFARFEELVYDTYLEDDLPMDELRELVERR